MPAVGQSRSFGDVSSSFRVADTAARRRRSSHHVDRAAELCAPPARGRRQCRRKIPKTAPSRAQPVAPDATHRGPIFYYLTRSPNNMPVRIVDYVLARSATWLARPHTTERVISCPISGPRSSFFLRKLVGVAGFEPAAPPRPERGGGLFRPRKRIVDFGDVLTFCARCFVRRVSTRRRRCAFRGSFG
jgi:hypothetical protein